MAKRPRVLAIGLDAAEGSLVSELTAAGELPSLARLARQGRFGRVVSPAWIGSGAVWPAFVSGKGALDHGLHSYWCWDPAKMGVAPMTVDHLQPFWGAKELDGLSLGVVDVPFAPLAGVRHGIEISEWGSHEALRGWMEVSPSSLKPFVEQIGGKYPISGPTVDSREKPPGQREIEEIVARGCEGARLRGALAVRLLADMELDLFLAVFHEVHRASHLLWHTVASRASPGLLDIYREVDRQIGRLVEAAGPSAAVLVFSLHGMRAPGGAPTVLDPVLRAAGFSTVRNWGDSPGPEKRERALKTLKGLIPHRVKRVIYRMMSLELTARLARPGMIPPYDWARTIAFSHPSDQHGWIRVNLAGREAAGIVARERYRETCREIEALMRGLVTEEGLPVVKDVVCLGDSPKGPPRNLPDLVINWTDAALAPTLRLRAPALSGERGGPRFSGRHSNDGFFILRSASGAGETHGESILAEDLHRMIVAPLLAPVG